MNRLRGSAKGPPGVTPPSRKGDAPAAVRAPERLVAAVVAATVVLSGACASGPAEAFYTLNAGVRRVDGATPRAEKQDAAAPAPWPPRSVVVAPPALPELIDRPQLVLRTGPHRVELLEQSRWAEPLRAQIARVVAEDLETLLGGWRIATSEDGLVGPACRVNLDVRRLEASRAGPALSDVLWRVACAGSVRTGRTVAAEPVGPEGLSRDGLAPVVAAQGRALDPLSRDLAAALREAGR
jgi:uncharacterized lipoprotein YmbA